MEVEDVELDVDVLELVELVVELELEVELVEDELEEVELDDDVVVQVNWSLKRGENSAIVLLYYFRHTLSLSL